MKILISSDGRHAHFYQRMAWLKAFRTIGIEASIWDCKAISPFDAFDSFEPDIFMGQAYNLTPSLIKCIYERPHLKIGLRAGDWGDHEEQVDKSQFNILYAAEQEKEALAKLKEETGKPDFVHIHYDQDAMGITHNHWKNKLDIDTLSLMLCADIDEYYYSSFQKHLACDIGFVGGYWPYKSLVIDQYLLPLCFPVGHYNIKIFGNQPWSGVNQYCGVIGDPDVKNLFASAKISPNLSEPHAQEFGFDVNERVFKILCAGGFCVSDHVESINKIFGDTVPTARSRAEFADKIAYYLQNEDERNDLAKKGKAILLDGHTNFHRISSILKAFGYAEEANDIINKWNRTKEELNATR